MNWDSREFLREYVDAIRNGSAAVFVGAGMSRSAGYVDWRGLLRRAATDMGLDVDKESDLVALAQFYRDHSGTRGPINQMLIEAFPDLATTSEVHELLARLSIRTLWTTNYDRLIEGGFKHVGKRLQTVVTNANMAITVPDRDAVLFKLHGDIEQPDQAVLTKEDYERFQHRPEAQLFMEALKGDLVEKTFLFIGFSFEDPNLDYILARIRVLIGENKRRHYWVVKAINPDAARTPDQKAQLEYERRRQNLRIKDLVRYGITAVMIQDYSDIPKMLRQLAVMTRLNRVFISGAVHDPAPLGMGRIQELAEQLGSAVVKRGCVAVSGFGKDIGPHVVYGAIQTAHETRRDYTKCVDIRPFPYMAPPAERPTIFRRHREQLISDCGVAVFICGNKQSPEGETVPSSGMREEHELCVAHGVQVVPLGCTGHVAQEIWKGVSVQPDAIYGRRNLLQQLKLIGDQDQSNEIIMRAVGEILDHLTTI